MKPSAREFEKELDLRSAGMVLNIQERKVLLLGFCIQEARRPAFRGTCSEWLSEALSQEPDHIQPRTWGCGQRFDERRAAINATALRDMLSGHMVGD